MPSKKYFTLEEANSLIPELLDTIPKIQKLTQFLKNQFPDVQKAWKQAKFNGGSVEGPAYLQFALKINHITKNLTEKGCVLKGIENGLVDFPAVRNGKEVFLCWKLPEKEITHWHDLDAGFAGRQPLP